MSPDSGAGPLVPTFHGFVQTSMDALVLFETCLSGKLHHVPRRPRNRERKQLIKSGSIFIYEENASGINRWTDGVAWSPSRILGNFLIYRELEKPLPPGEKKRAMKRKRVGMPDESYPRRDSDGNDNGEQQTPLASPTPGGNTDVKFEPPTSKQDKQIERSLIGPLVDSYGFRPDGLVKKTMSISINGISHHMVSYYKVDDVKNNLLSRPTSDPRLQNMSVRPELYLKQNFRAPVEQSEHCAIDGQMQAHPQMMYSAMQQNPYAIRPGQYFGEQRYANMYSVASTGAGGHWNVTGTAWPDQPPVLSGAIAYGSHPAYAGQSYGSGYYRGLVTRTPTPTAKAEEAQSTSPSMGYGSQYQGAYPNMQRNGIQTATRVARLGYQPLMQQQSSSFGAMAYDSYGGQPTATEQPAQQYGSVSAQQYAVRSPTQSYGGTLSTVVQSPHQAVKKRPHFASVDGQTPVPYRASSHAVRNKPQSGHPSGEMSGRGINGDPGYGGQPPQGERYRSYSPSEQQYRPEGEMGTAQTAKH